MQNYYFFISRSVYVKCAIVAELYTHSNGYQPHNMVVVFKMLGSVPSNEILLCF